MDVLQSDTNDTLTVLLFESPDFFGGGTFPFSWDEESNPHFASWDFLSEEEGRYIWALFAKIFKSFFCKPAQIECF